MLTPETLKTQIRLYLAMKMVNQDKGFDFCGLKGQRELTEYVCLGDVPEMVMNDPYDWNGPKEPTVCATEADAYAAVTMQLLKYITGGLPSLFMDVRLYLPELNIWDWCNSGNHSSWYAKRSFDPAENFDKITFHPALEFYFKAGGASVEFDAEPGEMTFARLGLWDDKPFMAIIKGEAVDLPAEERQRINDSTDPTWPHVHAQADLLVRRVPGALPVQPRHGHRGRPGARAHLPVRDLRHHAHRLWARGRPAHRPHLGARLAFERFIRRLCRPSQVAQSAGRTAASFTARLRLDRVWITHPAAACSA